MKQSTLFKQWGQKKQTTTAAKTTTLTNGNDVKAATVVSSNGRKIIARGSSINGSTANFRSQPNFNCTNPWLNSRSRAGNETHGTKQTVAGGQSSLTRNKQKLTEKNGFDFRNPVIIDLEANEEEQLRNESERNVAAGVNGRWDAEAADDEMDDRDMMSAALELEKMGFNADQHADGFEVACAQTWIYPTNMPVREYQFEIVEKALFHNTMVVLPTGLGKTFIAAVIMYNYHRWFPAGKAVFLAPTKPLVNQQISACTKIMGLPKDDIVELTGQMNPKKREQLWNEKQLLFLTPQTMSNDLNRDAFDPKSIRLLMVDEAHKAKGNYAYCQVVAKISESHSQFRVVALTATPGGDVKAVQEVVNNLKISRIEVRTEQQLAQYCHNRSIQTHVVHLRGPILQIRTQFLQQVLMPLVGKMRQSGLMWSKNAESLSRFEILSAWGKFREKQGQHAGSYSAMSQTFYIGQFLYQAWEFLNNQGLRTMFCHLRDGIDGNKTPYIKSLLRTNQELMDVFDRLKARFEGKLMECLDASAMLASQSMNASRISTTSSCASEDFYHSHPKLEKLEEIVLQHFKSRPDCHDTRVMIFSTYRESVHEITEMLMRHKPMIKVMSFVGQGNQSSSVTNNGGMSETCNNEAVECNEGFDVEDCDQMFEQVRSMKRTVATSVSAKGLKQAHQKRVIEKFKSGHFNVLVSTCVGEEGLDIGEVDLIVNFDTPKSLVRLIQRAGRTGRKRHGVIHAILTAGKEESTYKNSTSQTNKMDQVLDLVRCDKIKLHPVNPRVIPAEWNPVVVKKFLVTYEKESNFDEPTETKTKKSKLKENTKKPTKKSKKEEPNDESEKVVASEIARTLNPSACFEENNALPDIVNDVSNIATCALKSSNIVSIENRNINNRCQIQHNEPGSGRQVDVFSTATASTGFVSNKCVSKSDVSAKTVARKQNCSATEKRETCVDDEFNLAINFFPLSEVLMKEFNEMLVVEQETEEKVNRLSYNINESCIIKESPNSVIEVNSELALNENEERIDDDCDKANQYQDDKFANSLIDNEVIGNDGVGVLPADNIRGFGDQNQHSLLDKSNDVEQAVVHQSHFTQFDKFDPAVNFDPTLSRRNSFDVQESYSQNSRDLVPSLRLSSLETTLEKIRSNYEKNEISMFEQTKNRTFEMNFDYKFVKVENSPRNREVTSNENLAVSKIMSTKKEEKSKMGRLSEATCSYTLSDDSINYEPLMARINRKYQPEVSTAIPRNQPTILEESDMGQLNGCILEDKSDCFKQPKQVAVVQPTIIDSSIRDTSTFSRETKTPSFKIQNTGSPEPSSTDPTKTPLRNNQRLGNFGNSVLDSGSVKIGLPRSQSSIKSLDSSAKKTKTSKNKRPIGNKRRKIVGRFLATQAHASDGGDDDEDHSSDWQSDDLEFLASQPVHDKSEMQYVYMRSVNRRSPSLSPTAFLKKYLRQPASKLTKHDVMSQPVHEDSSYIEDSFFVDDEEDIVYSESESWSSDENCDTGDVSGTPHENASRTGSAKSRRQRTCSKSSSFIVMTQSSSRKRKSGSPVVRVKEHRKRRRRVLAASMLDESSPE